MPYPSADPGGAIIIFVALLVLVYFIDIDEKK